MSDSAGALSGSGTPTGDGTHESDSAVNNWLNFALFSIGGVAAVGLVVILFGAYLMESENAGVIIAGTIILMVAVIAWILTALIMVGDLIRKLVTSRGNKPRKSPPQ